MEIIMKYIRYITILLIGLITTFCIWMYIERVNLNYNAEGVYFSPESGVVYYEQAKEVYAILIILGLISIGILIFKWIKK